MLVFFYHKNNTKISIMLKLKLNFEHAIQCNFEIAHITYCAILYCILAVQESVQSNLS